MVDVYIESEMYGYFPWLLDHSNAEPTIGTIVTGARRDARAYLSLQRYPVHYKGEGERKREKGKESPCFLSQMIECKVFPSTRAVQHAREIRG